MGVHKLGISNKGYVMRRCTCRLSADVSVESLYLDVFSTDPLFPCIPVAAIDLAIEDGDLSEEEDDEPDDDEKDRDR